MVLHRMVCQPMVRHHGGTAQYALKTLSIEP